MAMDEDERSNLDDGPKTAEPHDDVASNTSFQPAPPANPTTTAMCLDEIKSVYNAPSPRRDRGGARRGRSRATKHEPTTKTQTLPTSQPVVNDVY